MTKSKFIPYFNKVYIKPFEEEGMLRAEGDAFLEKGTVLAVGRDCKFLKKGDTVFFSSWGCDKTPPDEDGNVYYVLAEQAQFILGKLGHGKST